MSAVSPTPAAAETPELVPQPLQLGIDVLVAEGFARLRGEPVAVLTNDMA